jgi:hypothetical protein
VTTIDDLYGAVALELGLAGDGGVARVKPACDAAVQIASRYCYGPAAVAVTPMIVAVPVVPIDQPMCFAGLIALSVRVMLDPRSPAGVLESDAYTGAVLPSDLLAHVHHYFDPFRSVDAGAFGIA